jgi:nitrate reductase delta subunit
MSLLKLIGVLMDYPQDALWEHRQELIDAAADPALSPKRQVELAAFARGLLDTDALVAQDNWLVLFDRGRSMSLLLFEHIHGESRDRGQAMVDLLQAYRRNGFELTARELPDYLPLLLEYLDQRPPEEARDWLQHIANIVGLLAARAGERGSCYAVLFEILVESATGTLDLGALRRRAGKEPRDDTREVMDRLWEEEAVRFDTTAPDGHCPPAGRPPASSEATRQVQP